MKIIANITNKLCSLGLLVNGQIKMKKFHGGKKKNGRFFLLFGSEDGRVCVCVYALGTQN